MKLPFNSFEPDFDLLLKVLRRETTPRPVLFEFMLNLDLCRLAAGWDHEPEPGSTEYYRMIIEAFRSLGYDYAPVYTWKSGLFSFPKGEQQSLASRSHNEGVMIADRESFERYPWPDARSGNYELYNRLDPYLPAGMKLVGFSNGGILENAIDLVGFDNLCMMYLEDPELTQEVFPYTKKIVSAIHEQGKTEILHSCGNLKSVMDEIIDELRIDGKHSFEDGIYPLEDAYTWWHDRIAIMGGIDVDYLVRRSSEEIYRRSMNQLETTSVTGGYALGSGNSIPAYIPLENYLAMLRAAADFAV